jgi:hypothetical protein
MAFETDPATFPVYCYGHHPRALGPPELHYLRLSDMSRVLTELSKDAAFEEGRVMCVHDMVIVTKENL